MSPQPSLPLWTPETEQARYIRVLPSHEARVFAQWSSITFLDYQRQWLFDPAQYAVCNKSRQIGISLSTGGWCVLRGAYHGEHTIIISRGEDEALNVLAYAKRHVEVLLALGSRQARTRRRTTKQIEFISGGSITALASTGGRSWSGNVVLDEFAYHKHAKETWSNTAPVAMLGHRMRVISTPGGVGNEFHDLWEHAIKGREGSLQGLGKSAWSPHEYPIQRAIKDGLKVNLDHCWQLAKGDPRIFAQDYECSFLDGELQYIPTELIDKALVHEPLHDNENDRAEFEYYAGLDVGRDVDLSVLVVIRRHKRTGRCRVVWVETIKRSEPEALRDMVRAAFDRYRLKRVSVDQTGIGWGPGADIKRELSEKYDPPNKRPKVDLVDFTVKSKAEMATGLYSVMTGGLLDLPGSDAALPTRHRLRADGTTTIANEAGTWKTLHREIASIQRKITTAANVIYETPRTREGHADRAWALMLAVLAMDPVHPMVRALSGGKSA